MPNRTCGECKLCCYLVPTADIGLAANTHCQHECSKGCAIYERRPMSCQMWSCQWLLGADVGLRPDRSGYVVDMMPDFVTSVPDNGSESTRWPVHQVWIDPARPEAHKAPALRRWVEEQGKTTRMMTIVRFGNDGGLLLCPPSMSDDGRWHEVDSNMRMGPANTAGEVVRELTKQGISLDVELVNDDQSIIRIRTGGDHDRRGEGHDPAASGGDPPG